MIGQRTERNDATLPSAVLTPMTSLEQFGLYVSGFPTSPCGIEWMRFDESSPLHPLIKSLPHVAFEVDDLDAVLIDQEIIFPPGSPSDGVRAALIVVDGAPVELIWFRKQSTEGDVRPQT